MPRPPRLVLPDVPLHIVQRGNNRAACFRSDSDYLVYLHHLRTVVGQTGCRVHAYCLMPNHVHLLLTAPAPDACSSLMRDLGQRYVRYFNDAHERTGTLWEGRYRSCVVQSSAYVLACYRYIELNPVRAGIVALPADYRWSSCRANAQLEPDELIEPHPEFLALDMEAEARRRAYVELLTQGLDRSLSDKIRDATAGGCVLGAEAFKRTLAEAGRKTDRGRRGRPRKQAASPDSSLGEIGL